MKLFIIFLLLSLLPVGEIFLILYLYRYITLYLLLALLMVTSFLGFIISYWRIVFVLKRIKISITMGVFPEKGLMQLAGSFAASILLIFPGFISFITGIIIFLPGVNKKVGMLFNGSNNKSKQLYEYLKLYDL